MLRSVSRTNTAASYLAQPSVLLTTSLSDAQLKHYRDNAPMSSTGKRSVHTDSQRSTEVPNTTSSTQHEISIMIRHNTLVRCMRAVSSALLFRQATSMLTPAASQYRWTSHDASPNDRDAAALARDTTSGAFSMPSRRRFAHRRGPAKRATVNPNEESSMREKSGRIHPATPVFETTTTPGSELGAIAQTSDLSSMHTGKYEALTQDRPYLSEMRHPGRVNASQTSSFEGRYGHHDNRHESNSRRTKKCGAKQTSHQEPADKAGDEHYRCSNENNANNGPTASDLSFSFRLPPAPDAATATGPSLCSYMKSLRRCLLAKSSGSNAISLLGHRCAFAFLHMTLPILVQPPPGEDKPPSSDLFDKRSEPSATVRHRETEETYDRDAATTTGKKSAPAGKGFYRRPSLAEQMEELAGTGSVPWTVELAEATLLTAAQANLNIPMLWVCDAAVKFLLYDAAHSVEATSDGKEERKGGKEDVGAQRIGERARFAMAMLHAQRMIHRRMLLRKELKVPFYRRLRRSRRRATSSTPHPTSVNAISPSHHSNKTMNQVSRASPSSTGCSMDGNPQASDVVVNPPSTTRGKDLKRFAPSPSDASLVTVNLDKYLCDYLLPSLFTELSYFCAKIEGLYDATVSAAGLTGPNAKEENNEVQKSLLTNLLASHASTQPPPSSSATLNDDCLPVLSREQQETFAVLLSVFYRLLNQRGVARAGTRGLHHHHQNQNSSGSDGLYFRSFPLFTTVKDREADDKLAETTPRHLDGLPLRAFTIALASMATTMNRIAGAQSGLLEDTLRRASRNQADLFSAFVGNEENDGGEVKTGNEEGPRKGDSASQARRPASASPGRFQQRKVNSDTSMPTSDMTEAQTARMGQPSCEKSTVNCPRDTQSPPNLRKLHGGAAATSKRKSDSSPILGNFNLEPLVSVLKFCYHDHALQLLIDAPDVPPFGGAGHEDTSSEITHTHTDMRLNDCAREVARASLTLLQVSLHWAPLCRTTQLPAVAHAVGRILKYSPVSSSMTSQGMGDEVASHHDATNSVDTKPTLRFREREKKAAKTSVEEEKLADCNVTPASTLDGLVYAHIQQLFFVSYADTATFEKMTRRLILSSLRYALKQKPGSFVSTTTEVDQIFSHWPRALSDRADNAPNNTNNRTHRQPLPSQQGVLCYPVPPSATTDVLLFATFMEDCWINTLTQAFWVTIPACGLELRNGDNMQPKRTAWDGAALKNLKREPKTAAVRVWLSEDEHVMLNTENKVRLTEISEGGEGGKKGGTAHASGTDRSTYLIPAPLFTLSWLRDQVGNSPFTATPDMIKKLLSVTDHVTAYLAVPNSAGRTLAALPMLREWHSMPYARDALNGSMESFFATQEMRLYVASMGLPTVLMKPASDTTTTAGAVGGASLLLSFSSSSPSVRDADNATRGSSLQRVVQRVKCHAGIVVSWLTRVNPLPLYMTPSGRLCSPSAVALQKLKKVKSEAISAEISATSQAGEVTGEMVWLCRGLSETTLSWLPTWRENGFSLPELTTLLRALHIMSMAEERISLAAPLRCSCTGTDKSIAPNPDDSSSSQHLHTKLAGARNGNAEQRRMMERLRGFQLSLPLWGASSLHELLLRMSHRVLFSPQDRAAMEKLSESSTDASAQEEVKPATRNKKSVAAASSTEPRGSVWQDGEGEELFRHDPAASLETLVTLYLALLAAVQSLNVRRAATSFGSNTNNVALTGEGNRALHERLVMPSLATNPLMLSRQVFRTCVATSLQCCLAECEATLKERLRGKISEVTSVENDVDGSTVASRRWQSPSPLTSSVEALLELSMLIEEAWPDVMITPMADREPSLPHKLSRLFQKELVVRLRQCSSRTIAAMLSNHLWWTARQQQRQGVAIVVPVASWGSSWVEQTILDALGEKLHPANAHDTQRAGTPIAEKTTSTASPEQVLWRRSFEVYEWVLMPFYVKLELRQRAVTKTLASFSCASSLNPTAAIHDDFTSLEDVFEENRNHSCCGGSADASNNGNGGGRVVPMMSSNPPVASGLPYTASISMELDSSILLEKALQALVSHCDSFDMLLHVVRYLFLSHPATLTTAPSAAVQLDAAAAMFTTPQPLLCETASAHLSTSAQASRLSFIETLQAHHASLLPLQWVNIPQSLRQRYVDTLYRLFLRLVYLSNTSLTDLFELLHVLWLADPSVSQSQLSCFSSSLMSGTNDNSSSNSSRSTPSSGKRSASGASAARSWPSLFQRCADFVRNMLASDLHRYNETEEVLEEELAHAQRRRDTSVRGAPIPNVLYHLRATLEQGLLTTLSAGKDDGWQANVATLHLPPVSVLLFLHALAAQVCEERAAASITVKDGEERHKANQSPPRLTPSQRAVLSLLEPFVLYTVVTSGTIFNLPKATYLPLFLEVLSELDPRLVLTVIQAAFTGHTGARHPYSKRLQSSALASASSAVGARTRGPRRSVLATGADRFEEHAHNVSAIVSAMVMVAHQAQASSPVWSSLESETAGEEEGESSDSMASTESRACEGSAELSQHLSSNCVGGGGGGSRVALYTKNDTQLQVGKAQQRAIAYLSTELWRNLSVPLYWQPLRFTDPAMLLQLFQLSMVRRHHRLSGVLTRLLLKMLTVSKVGGRDASTAMARRRQHRENSSNNISEDATATTAAEEEKGQQQGVPLTSLSPVGKLLLRQLPLPLWRELFYQYICHPPYFSYQRRLKLLHMRKTRLHRHQRRTTFYSDPSWLTSTSHRKGDERDVEGNADDAVLSVNTYDPSVSCMERTSLDKILLALDAASTQTLIHEIMSPTVLLTITADLVQRQWWERRSSGRKMEKTSMTSTSCMNATAVLDGVLWEKDTSYVVTSPAAISSSFSASHLPSSTYSVLLRYASAHSVLREAQLQPYLKAACKVLDQLASANRADFFSVLRREAAWRQQVKDGPARQQQQQKNNNLTEDVADVEDGAVVECTNDEVGVNHDQLCDGNTEATLASTPAHVVDIENDPFDSADESDSAATAREGDSTNMKYEGEQREGFVSAPLVLDLQPIARLVRVLYHVDPTIMERQLREIWFSHRNVQLSDAAFKEEAVEQQRDALHDGIEAILERVGDVWRASSRKKEGPAQAPQQQRLLVMNLNAVLDLYIPYINDGGTQSLRCDQQQVTPADVYNESKDPHVLEHAAPTSLTSSSTTTRAKDAHVVSVHYQGVADWLDASLVYGRGNNGGGSSSSPSAVFNDIEARMRPLVWTSRATKTVSGRMRIVTAETARRARRAALMRCAGMLMTAQEAEDRCDMLKSNVDLSEVKGSQDCEGLRGDEKLGEVDANAYWQERQTRVHQRVLESVFGMQASFTTAGSRTAIETQTNVQETGNKSVEPEASNTMDAEYERQVQQRLELMRSEDVTQLLRLLLKQSDFDIPAQLPNAAITMKQHATTPNMKFMQARILMARLAEVLPNASPREVLGVAQSLLQLYVDMTTVTASVSTGRSTHSFTSARHVVFEIRRLLSNVGVLLANDAERFCKTQLVWLLTRLHTPRLRGVVALMSDTKNSTERPSLHSSAQTANMALDVSDSFLSASVARTLTMVSADASAVEAAPVLQKSADSLHVAADTEAPKLSVTVGVWMAAVAAAELRPSFVTVTALLRLIEASAL